MKRSLAIIFAILTLSIFFLSEKGSHRLCSELEVEQFIIEDAEQSFSQGDNYLDLNGRKGSSSTVSIARLRTKSATSSGGL